MAKKLAKDTEELKSEILTLKKQLKSLKKENKVLKSLEVYSNIIDNINEGILVTDRNDEVFFVNNRMSQIAGVPEASILGSNIYNDFSEETVNEFNIYYSKAKESLTPQWYEVKIVTPAGRPTYQNGWLIPRLKKNKYDGIICTVRDVTQKVESEIQLKNALTQKEEKEQELSFLLRASNVVLNSEDFDEAARRIFNLGKEITGAVSGYVALMSDDGEENELLFLDDGGLPCTVDPELPMPIRGLRSEAYFKNDVVFENDFMKSEWEKFMPGGHVELRNVLFAPIPIKGKVVGIIGLANKPGEFNEKDCRLMKTLGEVVSTSLSSTRTNELLRHSEIKFRGLSELSPSGIYMTDKDGKCTYANQTWLDMAGLKLDEALGDGWLNGLHPEDKDLVFGSWNKMVKSNGSWGIEYRFRGKNGAPIWVRGIAKEIKDKNGYISGYIGVNIDITEKKITEEKIRKNHAVLTSLLENSDASVWLVDKNYNMIYCNDAFNKDCLDSFGRVIEQGESLLLDILPQADMDKWKSYYDRALAAEKFNFELKRKFSSTHKWNEYFFSSIKDDNNNIIGVTVTAYDVTERKKAEASLKESERNLKAINENSGDIILSLDTELNVLFINSMGKIYFKEILKIDINIKDNILTLVPEFLRDKWRDRYTRALDGETFTVFDEYTIDNEKFWSEVVFFPMKEDEKIIGISVFSRDITEKKNAEEKIKQSEKRYRTIVSSMSDMIFVFDNENNYIDVHCPEGTQLYKQKNEFIGKPISSIMPESHVNLYLQASNDLRNTGQTQSYEYHLDIEGVRRYYLATLDLEDGTNYIIAGIKDITTLKEIKLSIQKSENFNRLLLDSTAEAIYGLNLEGKCTFMNVSCCEILGIESEDEVLGKNIHDLIHHTDENGVKHAIEECNIYKALKDGKGYHDDTEVFWNVEGQNFPVEYWSYPIIEHGEVIGAVVTFNDITERKYYEQTIIESRDEMNLKQKISNILLSDYSDNAYTELLDVIRVNFGSFFGYIGYIDENGDLVCPSMTRDIWEMCQVADKSIKFPKENWGGLWGEALKEKKSVVENSSLKLPEGHVQLRNTLIAPIVNSGELIGQIVLANKETDYDYSDLKKLEFVSNFLAPILKLRLERIRKEEEKERALKELRESEEKYRLLHENTGAGIGYYDIEGKLISFNNLAASYMGGDPGEFKGKTFEELFPKESETYRKRFNEAIHSDEAIEYIDELDFGTSSKWFLSTFTVIRNNVNNPIGVQIISQNITTLKQTELELIETEERYRALFENTRNLVTITDENSVTIWANPAWHEYFGDIKDYVDPMELIHSDDKDRLLKVWSEMTKTLEPIEDIEYRYQMPDGRFYYFRTNVIPVELSGKQHYYIIANDITAFRRAELKIIEDEKKYRSIVESTSEGFWILDSRGKCLEVNQKYSEMSGYTIKELVGKSVPDLEANESPEETKKHIDNIIKTGHDRFETKHRRKDGTTFDVEVSTSFIRIGEGVADSIFVAFVRDISKRRGYINRIERLADIFKTSINEIFIFDRDSLKFTDCNEAALSNIGYTIEEMTKLTPLNIKPEFNMEQFNEMLEPLLKGEKQVLRFTTLHERKDKSKYNAEIKLQLVNDDNPHFVAFINDVTEKIKSEQDLQRNEKALQKIIDRTSKVKGEEYFQNMVLILDEIIEPAFVFIGKLIENNSVETVALSGNGKLMNNFVYELQNTPCDNVVAKNTCVYKKDITKDFPQDQLLIDMGIESYIGTPIFNSEKEGIGILVALFKDELKDDFFIGSIFEVFSANIAKEMERNEAEKMLFESKERYKQLFHSSNDAVFVHQMKNNMPGKFIEVNDVASKRLGYSREELLELSPADIEGTDMDKARKQNLKTLSEYGANIFEMIHVAKNGKRIPVENSIKLFQVRDKEYALSIVRDITRWKLSEKTIRESEEQLRYTIDATNDGIWDWDILNNKVVWSERAFNMLGYETNEFNVTFDKWSQLLHDEDRDHSLKTVNESLETNEPFAIEFRLQRKDGSWNWIFGRGQCIKRNENGSPMRMIGTHQDISKQKEAEEKIAKNEKELGLIFDSSPSIMMLLNDKTEIININKTGILFANESYENIIGKRGGDIFKCIHSQNVEDECGYSTKCEECVFRKTVLSTFERNEEHKDIETKLHTVNGNNTITYDISLSTTLASIIPERTVLVTINDITEKKKAERNYQQLFETMESAFAVHRIICDEQGNPINYSFLSCNKAFEIMLNVNSTDIINRTVLDVFPSVEKYWIEKYGKVALKGTVEYFENYSQEFDKHFSVTAYSPEPEIFATIFQDITDRKKYEEALVESEVKYRTIFETAGSLILITNPKGLILDCNYKIKEFLQREKYELIGSNITRFVHNEDINFANELIEILFIKGTFRNKELKLLKKDSNWFHVLVNAVGLINDEGEYERSIIMMEDISELIEFNQQIENSRQEILKLSRHNEEIREEEKKNIAYLIHDDIGQALTALKLNLKLFTSSIEVKSDSQINQENDINVLIDETIHKVRDISTELRPAILDHIGLIGAVNWKIEDFKEKTGINTKFNTNIESLNIDDKISTVYYRILQEGLANIVRHSKTTKIELELKCENGILEMILIDNGVGIPKELLKDPKSFGLLAIKDRAISINGKLSIDSIPELGTTLTVTCNIKKERND